MSKPVLKLNRKMDATPHFGVTMISEVPSNPHLILVSAMSSLVFRPLQNSISLKGFLIDPEPIGRFSNKIKRKIRYLLIYLIEFR